MKKKVNPEKTEEVSSAGQPGSPIWTRPERVRRERPALSRDQITLAAMTLADTEGVEAISIRRIAAALEVSPMALYWYIESKEDVLALLIDAAYGEMTFAPSSAGEWRANFEEIAIQKRTLMHRHAWFAALIGHRAVLGPNELKQTDILLGIVRAAGFELTIAMQVLELFNSFIEGFVLREMGDAEAQRRTGLSKTEWQQQLGPYVQKVIIESGKYPHLAKALVEGRDVSSDSIFRFGLGCLLDGVTHLVKKIG